MNRATSEQLVRARLWEDPLEAVQRGIKEKEAKGSSGGKKNDATHPQGERKALDIIDRVRPIRDVIKSEC